MIQKKVIYSVVLLTTSFLFAISMTAQIAPPPVKSVSVQDAELSEKNFETKIKASLTKSEIWKENTFAGFGIKAMLPRQAVRQSEAHYDPALGNVRITMFVSAGDSGTYVVGGVPIPYAITDEPTLRTAYLEAAKEFAADPEVSYTYSNDFRFNGKLGIEMIAPIKDNRFNPPRMRLIFLERTMYMLLATPHAVVGEDEPPAKDERVRLETEIDRFFASLSQNKSIAPKKAADTEPIYDGDYTRGVFHSKYFDFSISLPKGWIQVDQEDVEGVRKWGRDYVATKSKTKIPAASKVRQNLATFVSAPLGSESLAMTSINLGTSAVAFVDVMKFAKLAEELIGRVETYEIVRAPFVTTIGENRVVQFETRVKVEDDIQEQLIFFCLANGRVLAFTNVYRSSSERMVVMKAMESLRFESK